MRYCFLLIVLFSPLFFPFAGEAAACGLVNVQTSKAGSHGASISQGSFPKESHAEKNPVQQVNSLLKAREQKHSPGNFTNNTSVGIQPSAHCYIAYISTTSPGNSHAKLILYPKHYFW